MQQKKYEKKKLHPSICANRHFEGADDIYKKMASVLKVLKMSNYYRVEGKKSALKSNHRF